jgi:hypothetical protein
MAIFKAILFMLIVVAVGIMGYFSWDTTTKSTKSINKFSAILDNLKGETQERVHNYVETQESLTTAIKQLQNEVEYLKQELAKKTGIEIRAQNLSTSQTEQEAVSTAKQLLAQDHLTQAGLYFSHAISQAPGDWSIIHDYQQSILAYCQQRREQGEYQTAFEVLTEMEAFLRTQALYLSLPNLAKLEAALAEISQSKQSVVEQITTANHAEMAEFLTTLLAKSDELLSKAPAETPDQINQSLIQLKDHLLTLQSLDINQFEPTESAQLTEKIQSIENAIVHHEQQLQEIQLQANFLKLVQRAEQFINQAQQESTTSHFTLYYLTSAESIIRQLVLQMSVTEANKSQIATLTQQLEAAKMTIAQRESQRVWQEIQQAFEQLNIEEKGNAGEAIKQLSHFRQTMAEKSSQLVTLEYLEKAQALMEQVNSQIAYWQNEQRHRYEQWAVERIKNFYSFFQNELGMGTDELRVYQGIIHHLGRIDTRYLSTPALTGYNEAFNMFYAELSNERKIPLSSAMTLKVKKSLSDF